MIVRIWAVAVDAAARIDNDENFIVIVVLLFRLSSLFSSLDALRCNAFCSFW